MKGFKVFLTAAAIAMLVASFAPTAKASQGDWAAQITVSSRVQMGALVLDPGTYIVRRPGFWASNTIEVFSVDARRYVGFAMGVPVRRVDVRDTNASTPEDIKYWFYPDSVVGIKFLYPRT